MKCNDKNGGCKIKSRTAMVKAAFKKNMARLIRKLDLSLREIVNCYIWSTALFGAETWTLRKVEQKYLQLCKCGAGEGWKR
jgi:hypothetical protein